MKTRMLHITLIVTIAIAVGFGIAWTDSLVIPYTFTANTPALASEVNACFQAVRAAVNDNNSRITTLESELADAVDRIYDLETKLAYMAVETYTINGLSGPHVIFTGANVHIRSGSGTTNDSGSLRGLGNLIVGYDQQPADYPHGRDGSHNLVVGDNHEFPSYGGFVAGFNNNVIGACTSVSGGEGNTAEGGYANVSGGMWNSAKGKASIICGGLHNRTAIDADVSSIVGYFDRTVYCHYSVNARNFQSDDWPSNGYCRY
jgi:hypothetical protein